MNDPEFPDWTPKEKRWISRAKRLMRDKPECVLLYTLDGEITACKRGVPSNDLQDSIAQFAINGGCMLTDIHDDRDNGRG